jgi:PiT family inorganic phosphate transporter
MIGAALAKAGTAPLLAPGIIKTASFIIVSPMLGMLLGSLLMVAVSWLCFRQTPKRVDKWFRRLQLVSSAAYSLGHGGNDAQKTMGIIAALLFAHGLSGDHFTVPFWVVLACQSAMALGTLFGGWRIVRTMGSRITHLTPMQGVCAETAGSMTLFLATFMGIPVSTTHTITGAIVGVGAARRVSAVRWNVAKDIVVAWVVTMPAAALLSAGFYLIANAAGM